MPYETEAGRETLARAGVTMPGMSTIEGVVSELGRQIGLEGLALDAQGAAVLEFDGLPVTLKAEAATEQLLLYAFAGRGSGDAGQLYGRLLDANFLASENDGPVLSLVPGTDVVALHRALPAAELDLPSLTAGLEQLLADVAHWSGRLGGAPQRGNGVAAGLIRA